jgi:hypothetical protein
MTDNIRPPVRGTIRFTGPFLEPRRGYYHLGTDFGAQTPGVAGDPIFAGAARFSHSLARFLASIALSLIVIGGATDQAPAQEIQRRIATAGLNQFDLAGWCGREDRPGAPFSDSRFGFVSLSTGGAPEFIYIASRYYLQLGPHDEVGYCKFRRYLYRVDKAGAFKREEIGEKRFAQLEKDLQTYGQAFEKSNPGQRLNPTLTTIGDRDSVGGCLLPISWQRIGSQTYALFSIVAIVGITDYVVPHSERRSSDCYAWGDRRLANTSILSDELSFLSINVRHDLFFVESPRFKMGFLFKPDLDFQCLKGVDTFSQHILISRRAFDLDVRPGLNDLIKKRASKWQLSQSSAEPDVLSFSDSVFLSQEFAAFMEGLAIEKGCK